MEVYIVYRRFSYFNVPIIAGWEHRGVPVRVSYEFDGGNSTTNWWTTYTEGSVEHSWPPRLVVDDVLASLHGGANTLVVGFLADEGDATVATYDVRGFQEVIKPVQQHCEATE